MEYYGYIKALTEEEIKRKKIEITNYVNNKNIEIIFIHSLENIQPHSNLYLDNLYSLGSTIYQILNVFFELHSKKIKINIYNDQNNNVTFNSFSYEILIDLLEFEKKNITDRLLKTKETLNKKSKQVGRKKGKKTKSIFDKYKRTIFKELNKNISQVEILKKLKIKDSKLNMITTQALGKYIKKQREITAKRYVDEYKEIRSNFN